MVAKETGNLSFQKFNFKFIRNKSQLYATYNLHT